MPGPAGPCAVGCPRRTCRLKAEGTLKVRDAAGGQKSWPVSGGFFEVSHNRATVLADSVG